MARERQADGGIVRHDYNAFGQRTGMTDAMGRATRYGYDQLGRNTDISTDAVTVATFDGSQISAQSRSLNTRFTYDGAGRRLTQTNGAGETQRYAWDARGNQVSTTEALGQSARSAWDALGRQSAAQNANGDTATWTYDEHGQLSGHGDIGGASYAYRYDSAGQLSGQTSSRGQDQRLVRDAAGQVVRIDDAATGTTTAYRYDAGGQRVFEQTVVNGVEQQRQSLAYDSLGRLVQLSAMDGVSVQRDYDGQGNLMRQSVTSGAALPHTSEAQTLIPMGRAWTQVGSHQEPRSVQVQTGTNADGSPVHEERTVLVDVPDYGWQGFSALRNTISSGAPASTGASRYSQTQWYAYDRMNRQVLVDGALNGDASDLANLTADQGHLLDYDLSGQRTGDTHIGRRVTQNSGSGLALQH
ncbi:hypothetical protein [Polaromonas hydrogenivorans]|uniref:Teneurin-like YD-shell domain-containing protein n=1 Tax=Polaromonas hydrogenivorans TaxID=335476 RepID=A0AAU7LSS5_9BURK